MNHLALPPSSPTGLGALAATAAQLDPTVDGAHWQRSLVGPAAEFLARPGKQLRTSIVRAGWMLAGGAPEALPSRLTLAIELLHAGSLIVDDIEDSSDERRGAPTLHRLIGVPLAINTGNWLYFVALAELAETLPQALPRAVTTLARCHEGQALDLGTRVTELSLAEVPGVVAAITRLKTGALCVLGAELGARAAGADDATCAAIGALGEAMGTALQMLDDLGGLTSRRDKGLEDLRAARATWPWAWLAERGPFAWSRFIAMHDGDLDRLACDLGEAVAATGRARARAVLEGAFERAATVLGNTPALAALARELRGMEERYV